MVWDGDGDCYLGVLRFESQTSGPQTTNLPFVEKGDASMGRFFGVFTPWVHLQFPSRKALHTLSSPSPCRISKPPRSLGGSKGALGTCQLFPLKNAPAIKIGEFFVKGPSFWSFWMIPMAKRLNISNLWDQNAGHIFFRKATFLTSDLLIFACGRRLLSRVCELFFFLKCFKLSTQICCPFFGAWRTSTWC